MCVCCVIRSMSGVHPNQDYEDYKDRMELLLSSFFSLYFRAPFSSSGRKPNSEDTSPHPTLRSINPHLLPARIKAARRLLTKYSKQIQRLEENPDTFKGYTRVRMSNTRARLITRFLYLRFQYECIGEKVEPLLPRCDVCHWIDKDVVEMCLPGDVFSWFVNRSDEAIMSMIDLEYAEVQRHRGRQTFDCLD